MNANPGLRQTLRDFSVKQATNHQVMRAVIQHDDWLVPSVVAAQLLGKTSQELVMLGETFRHPARTLLLYTDVESAVIASDLGLELGPFARGIHGIEMFGAIDTRFDTVIVNEGCPTERKLYLRAPSFGNAAVWVDVVLFESVLGSNEPQATARDWVRGYDAYFVALHAENGAIVTMTNYPGFANAGLLFTAPDSLAAFTDAAPALKLQTGQTTGARVIAALGELGVDGLVINPYGPGATRAFSVAELAG